MHSFRQELWSYHSGQFLYMSQKFRDPHHRGSGLDRLSEEGERLVSQRSQQLSGNRYSHHRHPKDIHDLLSNNCHISGGFRHICGDVYDT